MWSAVSRMNQVFQGEDGPLCQIVLKIQEKYSDTEFGHRKLFSGPEKGHLSRVDGQIPGWERLRREVL